MSSTEQKSTMKAAVYRLDQAGKAEQNRMSSVIGTSRLLGPAFLLQAIASLLAGVILNAVLIVPGNTVESMVSIANNAWLMKASILGDTVTAVGIVFLGAALFVTLRERRQTVSLVALGLYVLEAAMLAASRLSAFALLNSSQAYVATGQPAYLQAMGSQALDTMTFGYTLALLPFGVGAVLFYYLLYECRTVPRALSLWGLLAVALTLPGTLLSIFGYGASVLYYPYAPFEFVIGIWIAVKGAKRTQKPGGL